MHPTQGEVNDSDGQVIHRSDLDELLGISTASMDFDVSSFRVCRRGSPVSRVHASPTGSQRHRPSDVVKEVSSRVSRLVPNDKTVPDST
jgi:hypothetical protein